MANPTRAGWRRWWLPVWCGLLTALILAPLTRRGFVLSYDMVTVPRQYLTPESLGVGSGLPRAVPQDAVLAVLTSVLPGELVYRVVLVGALFGASLGAGRLVTIAGLGAQTVAATAYVWNAYVAERLVIGHWTLLVAYAALPWIVCAAMAARRGDKRAVPQAIVLIAVSSLTPTGGLLVTVLATVLMPGRARWVVAASGFVLQLPWLVPAVLNSASRASDAAGVVAFAARPDSPLGLVGSVLSLGGIWNGDVVPDSRALASAAALTVCWVLLGAVGARDLAGLGLGRPLALIAAAGVGLALAGTWGGALAWAVEYIPGAGLLRDGPKYLAWYAVALAPAVGFGAVRVGRLISRVVRSAALSVMAMFAAVALPVLALPDLAWGVWGRLQPVEYPADWSGARDTVRDHADGRSLVVLPFQPFRSYPWNDYRTVLDPFPRFAGVETVWPDALTVGDQRLAGEDSRAELISEALASTSPVDRLRHAGIGLIAVQHDTPGDIVPDFVAGLERLYTSPSIDVYRVPGDVNQLPGGAPPSVVVPVDLAVLLFVAGVTGWLIVVRTRVGRSPGPGTVPAK